MSSLFDTPIFDVDLVFPSYQRLMQNLVELVHHLRMGAHPKYHYHLQQLERQYGYLLAAKPNLNRFSENQQQAIYVLKQLEQDLVGRGVLADLQRVLENNTSQLSQWMPALAKLLGMDQSYHAKMTAGLVDLQKSYHAVRDVWKGRVVRRVRSKTRRQSTYFVLSTLSSTN